jgi:hypothetical protein
VSSTDSVTSEYPGSHVPGHSDDPPDGPAGALATRRRLAVGLATLLACLVTATACGTPDEQSPPTGCLGTGIADVPATVGQPVEIGATVTRDPCSDFPVFADDPNLFKNEITVGDTVRLRLVAPLLPVRIEPISSEVHRLTAEHPAAAWRWRLIADEPGVHRLTIVASVLDPDGGETLIENRHVEVRLHAEGTVAYHAGRAWNGLSSFLISAQGMVVAIIAIVGALGGGGWLARRRARPTPEPEPDAAAERDRDPSGYL